MPGTPTPVLFYGSAETAIVLQTNQTQLDVADPIFVLAKSDPIAPAGASGECIFKNVYFVATYSMTVTVRLTPVIDFIEQTAEAVDIALVPDTVGIRQTKRFEVGLSLPYNSGAFRAAMRGAWFQLAVTTPGGLNAAQPTTDLILEQTELEFEVVRESLAAEN